MGLLLGASVVTVVELFDVLLVTSLSKAAAWFKQAGKSSTKTTYSEANGPGNSNHLIKAPSVHSLHTGTEHAEQTPPPGLGQLITAFNPKNYAGSMSSSTQLVPNTNYAFERSVFSFDPGADNFGR